MKKLFRKNIERRLVRRLGESRGRMGNTRWRVSNLEKGSIIAIERRERLRRLELTRCRLGEPFCRDGCCDSLHLLAQ
jgi:hypothetical protein